VTNYIPKGITDIMDNFNEQDYTPELYTLSDEEGKEQTFELIDTYVDGDERYYAMVPYFENPDDLIQSDGELVILKSDYVDGEEMLVTIDDDDEYERIGAIFLKRIEEMYAEMEEDECGCGCGCEHHDGCGCEDDDCDCGHCHGDA
jgi:UPF0473 protein athe_1150